MLIAILITAAISSFATWYAFRKMLKDAQRLAEKAKAKIAAVKERQAELDERSAELDSSAAALEQKRNAHVAFTDLQNENRLLKRDLLNIDAEMRKLRADEQAREARQVEVARLAEDLAKSYMKDHIKWNAQKLTPSNFASSKKRLLKVIDSVRKIGFEVSEEEEAELLAELQREYEAVVRRDLAKQEQARIREQLREEAKREREIQKELDQAQKEIEIRQAALRRAMEEAKTEAEVAELKARLAEAETALERTKSMAELTRAGYVYVISNVGAFGEDVYKIGLTRRLEPLERVKELGDASVPFPFDVHMMISSEDAPALESALHEAFHAHRLNKVNPRKEFFRVPLDEIRTVVLEMHGEVEYQAEPEALEYRETCEMTDEDYEYVSSVLGTDGDEKSSQER